MFAYSSLRLLPSHNNLMTDVKVRVSRTCKREMLLCGKKNLRHPIEFRFTIFFAFMQREMFYSAPLATAVSHQ